MPTSVIDSYKVKYKPWSKEEIALLAHLMDVGLQAGKTQQETAEFASKKLGRTKFACVSMYSNKLRHKPLSSFALDAEEKEEEKEVEVEVKKAERTPRVLMYGETETPREAIILAKTETSIVAKVGVFVVVVEL